MINCTYLRAIIWLNAKGKSASVRLTKLTRKSSVPIHPKHLVTLPENPHWFLEHIKPGTKVLDVGCGNGMHTIRAAKRGQITIIGTDYNLGHLHTGRALAEEAGITTASFFLGNIEHPLPFAPNQFDVIMLLDVIEHLYQRVNVLKEIRRVLRPDGILLVAAPNRNTTWKRRLRAANLPSFTDPDHKIEYTWTELAEELHAGDFEPIGTPELIVYDTPWAGFFDLAGGFSLALYKRLARWKVNMAHRHPQETSGWRVVCKRTNA